MIDDANAIKFCNERIRTTARKLAELIGVARGFYQEIDEDMATRLGIPYGLVTKVEELTLEDYGSVTPDMYIDGSPTDGRRPISNIEVLAWIRVINFLYNQGIALDSRVEKLARKIAFGGNE